VAAHRPVSSSPNHRQIEHPATTTTPHHKKPTEPHRVAVSTIPQCRHNRVVFSNPKQLYKTSVATTTKSHPPAAAPAAATTTRLSALAMPKQQYQQISNHASSPTTARRKLSEEDCSTEDV
jgi:hypothetical protein